MYRCECCGRVVPPRTPCARLVAESRPVVYPYRAKAIPMVVKRDGKRKRVRLADPGGVGWQIARERRACPECAAGDRGPSPTSPAVLVSRFPP
jgi:hypothetical protein